MKRNQSHCAAPLLVWIIILQAIRSCFCASEHHAASGTQSLIAVLNGGASALADPETEKQRREQQRIVYVKHCLNERLQHVQSGDRARDFEKWVRKRGDAVVFSMHGSETVELPPSSTTFSEDEDTTEGIFSILARHREKIFPSDPMNLDLVLVPSIPPLYPGKQVHLIDEGHPTALQLAIRAIRLTFQFSPITCTVLLAYIWPKFRENYWYKWMAACLASSGPAFIKWGQWASTREDMFPSTLCNALSQLHSEAPSHSWSFTKKSIESSLGLPYDSMEDIFECIDTTPIASGSIAQVHRAILKGDKSGNGNDGTLVAIKVRHPRVAKLIDMDFRLMSLLAKFVDAMPPLRWLHVRDSVEQFSHTMAAQAHLNVEAHHLEVLNYNFRKWPHVSFPRPFYASSSVIFETFESGKIITSVLDHYDAIATENLAAEKGTYTVEEVMDYDDTDSHPKEGEGYQLVPTNLAKFIVTTGLSTYLKMLLVDNLMHADLHPGNMLIDLNRNSPVPRRRTSYRALDTIGSRDHRSLSPREQFGIVLVDAGMVAQLNQKESVNFIGLLSAIGEGDGRSAGEFALRFSLEDETSTMTRVQREAFTSDMEVLFDERCKGYGTSVDVGEVLRGVLGLIRKHHVRIDANYATLVVNCLCIESLSRRICPDYNVLDAAKPLLRSFRKMCVDRNGGPKNTIEQNGVQQRMMKIWMPVLYFRKRLFDNRFFRRQERKFRRNSKAANQ